MKELRLELSNILDILHLVNDGAAIWPRVIWLQTIYLNPIWYCLLCLPQRIWQEWNLVTERRGFWNGYWNGKSPPFGAWQKCIYLNPYHQPITSCRLLKCTFFYSLLLNWMVIPFLLIYWTLQMMFLYINLEDSGPYVYFDILLKELKRLCTKSSLSW